MSDPKLLHKLDWRTSRADVAGYRIFNRWAVGEYDIVPYPGRRGSKSCWYGLDPITAQAVLIHIQQQSADVAESDQSPTNQAHNNI